MFVYQPPLGKNVCPLAPYIKKNFKPPPPPPFLHGLEMFGPFPLYKYVCSPISVWGGVTEKNEKIWDNVPIRVDPPPMKFETFLKNANTTL